VNAFVWYGYQKEVWQHSHGKTDTVHVRSGSSVFTGVNCTFGHRLVLYSQRKELLAIEIRGLKRNKSNNGVGVG